MDCQIKATCTGETSYAVCTKYESTVNGDSKLKNIECKSIEETIGEGFGILGKALAAGQKKESEAIGTFSAENFKNLGSAVASSTSSKRNIATLENALTNYVK